MIVFDGNRQAIEREAQLKMRVAQLVAGGRAAPTIAAILFREDTGSQLYTRLKREAAGRVGIGYQVHEFSLTDPLEKITDTISALNKESIITGIIVQKPWRKMWLSINSANPAYLNSGYDHWWQGLMSAVDPMKDVDGLHPETLAAVQAGTWQTDERVLPATCQAVLFALETAKSVLGQGSLGKTVIIGRTDLLGIPLSYVLRHQGQDVELIGSKELSARSMSGQKLTDASVVVSATGQKHLVTGDMLREGVVLIDVGEPQPDIERQSVATKASFLTPVPGGIGPLTVTFLLENALQLASKRI